MSKDMVSSRRGFVAAGAALVALPVVARAEVADAAAIGGMAAPSRPFALQHAADWQKQIGWRFAVNGEQGRVPMRLVAVQEVKETGKRPAGLARRSSFVAMFEADRATAPAGDALYKVSHTTLGGATLFLTRAADENGKARISATFS